MAKKKLSIKDLKAAPYNPRTIKPEAIAGLQSSLDKFGDIAGITWNKRTGNLVAGHQRLESLKRLYGDKLKFDGVKISCPDGKEFTVRVVDWDEPMEKAANITANNTFLQGDFTAGLKDIIVELKEGDFPSFDDLCFDDLSKMVSEADVSPIKGLKDDDDIPEVKTEPKTKAGDLYLLGDHRLLCGDATIDSDVDTLMDGQPSNMVFTDPPYNVDYGSSKNPRHKIRTIKNDSISNDEWKSFCKLLFANIKKHCLGDVYIWGASSPEGMKMRLWLTEMGCHWSSTIIWNKQQLVLSPANYQRKYEPCFYGWFGKSSFCADRKQTEVWDFDRPHNSKLHPTMKPVDICAYGIANSSKVGDIVLDGFGGSGSTLIACEKTKRKCYMMEIDPHYCDVIVKRWEDFTGKKAILTASK